MDTTTCFFFALILVNVLGVIHMDAVGGKTFGKETLGKPRHRQENNIKKELGLEGEH